MVKRPAIEDSVPGQTVGEFVEEYCTKPTFDADGVQASAGILKNGKEETDPVPLAPPVGFSQPPDLMMMMRQMLREERYVNQLRDEGFETEEEAADYEIDDDPAWPMTPYEAMLLEGSPAPSEGSPPAPPSPSAVPAPAKGSGGAEGAVASPPPVTPPVSTST